jgi:hypothetical protein
MAFTSDDVGMKDHFYVDPTQSLDVYLKGVYPSSDLSNLAAHAFVLDGMDCSSMEGFLQSLKESDPEKQRDICNLAGKPAKAYGEHLNASRAKGDPLYWQGRTIDRGSDEYQTLLDRAYQELSGAPNFQTALLASDDKLLVHTIGKKHPEETILTEWEFCSRLLQLQHLLRHSS